MRRLLHQLAGPREVGLGLRGVALGPSGYCKDVKVGGVFLQAVAIAQTDCAENLLLRLLILTQADVRERERVGEGVAARADLACPQGHAHRNLIVIGGVRGKSHDRACVAIEVVGMIASRGEQLRDVLAVSLGDGRVALDRTDRVLGKAVLADEPLRDGGGSEPRLALLDHGKGRVRANDVPASPPAPPADEQPSLREQE
jgi:hypothetical protein